MEVRALWLQILKAIDELGVGAAEGSAGALDRLVSALGCGLNRSTQHKRSLYPRKYVRSLSQPSNAR